MTNETERRLAKRTAHAMRTAALRLALDRVDSESDPALAYGCVDWFRYDAPPQSPEEETPAPPAVTSHDDGRGDASLHH